MPAEKKDSFKIGQKLEITEKYLNEALDYCELAFALTAIEIGKKTGNNSDESFHKLNDIVMIHLKKKRYMVAEFLSSFLSENKDYPAACQMIAKVNYWIAVKYQNRFSEIEKAIRDLDLSGMADIYKLARLCLLNDYEAFFKMLPRLVKNKDIDEDELKSWPLFEEVRKLPEYEKFMLQNFISKPLSVKKTKNKLAPVSKNGNTQKKSKKRN